MTLLIASALFAATPVQAKQDEWLMLSSNPTVTLSYSFMQLTFDRKLNHLTTWLRFDYPEPAEGQPKDILEQATFDCSRNTVQSTLTVESYTNRAATVTTRYEKPTDIPPQTYYADAKSKLCYIMSLGK